MKAQDFGLLWPAPPTTAALTERVAQLIAHRACTGAEHDPTDGKLHGCCVVCGVPWPCAFAGEPPKSTPAQLPTQGGK